MPQSAVRQLVADASRETQSRSADARMEAKAAEARIERRRAQARARARFLDWKQQRWIRRRAGQIFQGLHALSELGTSAEFQSLLGTRGVPIQLWGVHWRHGGSHDSGPAEYVADLQIAKDAIILRDLAWIGYESGSGDPEHDSTYLELEYATKTGWFASPWLRDLSVQTQIVDLAQETDAFNNMHSHTGTDAMLWQAVANCANPAVLEDYVRTALASLY